MWDELADRALATGNTAYGVGIMLSPEPPSLSGISHLNRFLIALALALKNQVIGGR